MITLPLNTTTQPHVITLEITHIFNGDILYNGQNGRTEGLGLDDIKHLHVVEDIVTPVYSHHPTWAKLHEQGMLKGKFSLRGTFDGNNLHVDAIIHSRDTFLAADYHTQATLSIGEVGELLNSKKWDKHHKLVLTNDIGKLVTATEDRYELGAGIVLMSVGALEAEADMSMSRVVLIDQFTIETRHMLEITLKKLESKKVIYDVFLNGALLRDQMKPLIEKMDVVLIQQGDGYSLIKTRVPVTQLLKDLGRK